MDKSKEKEPSAGQSYCPLGSVVLDSSLIIGTLHEKLYNVKMVSCGDYVQVYFLENKKKKSIKEDKIQKNIDNNKINKENKTKLKSITLNNIMRSKFECQRLAKCNSKDWKTFITLTFKENINDLNYANEKYKRFTYKVKRVFPTFKCLGVPEFQKRGAVHYHLLTNIDINNDRLIYHQIDNEKFLHIKYWIDGFDSIENVEGDMKKITGYISKYMTKDIDNRLYGHHRYFFTRNLQRPIISFLNFDNPKHLKFYINLLKNKKEIYSSSYINPYNNEKILFREFLSNS